ncbi:MAG: transposase [Deltaproteobacteria bacterium]
MSFCQRFGSSLNLNTHGHVIVPDAVFLPDASGEWVATLKHRAPTRLDLEEIATRHPGRHLPQRAARR